MTNQIAGVDAVPGLRDAVTRTAEYARVDAPALPDPLTAERWAAGVAVAWTPNPELDHLDREALFGLTLVSELESAEEPGALAALRALATVGSQRFAGAARDAGDRLRARGLDEPRWTASVGRARPARALAISDCERAGGEVIIGIDFAYGARHPHALVGFIDYANGRLKHLALVTSLEAMWTGCAESEKRDTFRSEELSTQIAATELATALELTDLMVPAPGEGLPETRALLEGAVASTGSAHESGSHMLISCTCRSTGGRRSCSTSADTGCWRSAPGATASRSPP